MRWSETIWLKPMDYHVPIEHGILTGMLAPRKSMAGETPGEAGIQGLAAGSQK